MHTPYLSDTIYQLSNDQPVAGQAVEHPKYAEVASSIKLAY